MADGDDKLSTFDLCVWNLCYSTLERFGCLTMFKVRGPDVRLKLDKHITFFVPRSHPRAADVRDYLLNELRHEAHVERTEPGDDWFWSTIVSVEFFSGLHGYVTREESEPLAEAAMENFMRAIQCPKVSRKH